MSDLADVTTDTPVADAPVDAPVADAPAADPFDSGQATFDRPYVEKLRNEAAANRVKAKEYEDKASRYSKFDGIDQTDLDVFGELANRYKTGDLEGAAEFARNIASQLSPAQRGDVAEATGAAPTDAPLTRAEFDKLMAEREQTQSVEAAQADLVREATELGYGPGTLGHLDVMRIASEGFKATGQIDLAAAAAKVKEMQDALLDSYIESKKADAARSPKSAPSGGAASGAKEAPKTLKDADAASRERVRAAFAKDGMLR